MFWSCCAGQVFQSLQGFNHRAFPCLSLYILTAPHSIGLFFAHYLETPCITNDLQDKEMRVWIEEQYRQKKSSHGICNWQLRVFAHGIMSYPLGEKEWLGASDLICTTFRCCTMCTRTLAQNYLWENKSITRGRSRRLKLLC